MYIFEEPDSKSDSQFHLCVEPELEPRVLKKIKFFEIKKTRIETNQRLIW